MRRDYILRMVETFANALARIVGQIEARQFPQASARIEQAFNELIGSGAETVAQLSETELIARLTLDGPTHLVRDKTFILIALLREAAQLHAGEFQLESATACRVKALNILLMVQMQDVDLQMPQFVPTIDMLRDELGDEPLPLRTLAALWRHYERIGAYARAEDELYALLEAEPMNESWRVEAVGFYQRLLLHADSELDAGNLPRAEITAALAELGR